jgi:hypothetical protein
MDDVRQWSKTHSAMKIGLKSVTKSKVNIFYPCASLQHILSAI